MTGKQFFKSVTKKIAATVAAAACVCTLQLQPAQAAADPFSDFVGQTRAQAWNTRNDLRAQADATLAAPANEQVKQAIDTVVNGLFPGVIQENEARIAAEKAAAEEAARREAERQEAERREAERRAFLHIPEGVCPPEARACVDLNGNRSWLQENGRITYGPVPSSGGANGYDTPSGMTTVKYQVKDEVSRIFNNAPMPYSTYITNDGVAFHAGSPYILSHGCIHLNYGDAVHFFNTLKPGDLVYVYGDINYGYPNGGIR
ncbi:MAG: L,D-transpeptidase family protein [Corynebacterium sp.]|nr:L,D-transpeptidase family protein [Corynebacterium sp.]